MFTRQYLAPALLCLLVFAGGCASTGDDRPRASTESFPDRPVGYLSKTPEQSLAGKMTQKGSTIRGGWGYGRTDAFVLTVPSGRKRSAFHNTVPLESFLIGTRNEVEFTATPQPGRRYAVVDYGTVSRTLGTQNGRMYSVWRGRVKLIPEQESPDLYREAAGMPLSMRDYLSATPKTISVPREYWFDITDTFGGKNARKSLADAPALPGSGTSAQ